MKQRHISLRDRVRKRAGNCCEKCRVKIVRKSHQTGNGSIHHRRPRRMGGKDTLTNLILLCNDCHRDIHRDEVTASQAGWIVWADPDMTPVLLPCGWALLVPDGTLERLSAEEGTRLCAYTNGLDSAMAV